MKFNIQKLQSTHQRWLTTILAVAALSLTSTSCLTNKEEREVPIEERVDSFATAYFNWRFHKAIKYVTPESEKWIRYAASQVHKADLELINSQEEGASIEIEDIEHTDDSTANVRIKVSNYMRMDTIGKAGRMIDTAHFTLLARYQQSQRLWMIMLTELPSHKK